MKQFFDISKIPSANTKNRSKLMTYEAAQISKKFHNALFDKKNDKIESSIEHLKKSGVNHLCVTQSRTLCWPDEKL